MLKLPVRIYYLSVLTLSHEEFVSCVVILHVVTSACKRKKKLEFVFQNRKFKMPKSLLPLLLK